MIWQNGGAFWYLFLLVVFFVTASALILARKKRLARVVSPVRWAKVFPQFSLAKLWLSLIFFSAGFFFLVLALARPQWGLIDQQEITRSSDFVILLDVSLSMEAQDVAPSRLELAKALIKNITQKMEGDRIGLIAFAGSSYVLSPLTTDLGYIRELNDLVNTKTVSTQGTDFGSALQSAARMIFKSSEASNTSQAAILLISDGEDFGDSAKKWIKEIAGFGARVYTVGVGTEAGAPIPLKDADGVVRGFKRTAKGQSVVTQFKPKSLMELAELGHGRYLSLSSAPQVAEQLTDDLKGLSQDHLTQRRVIKYQERYQIFLALALLFFALESLIGRRKWVGKTIAMGIIGFAVYAPTVYADGGPTASDAFKLDPRAYLETKRALESLENKDLPQAQKHFDEAARLNPNDARLEFNQSTGSISGQTPEESLQNLEALQKSLSKRAQDPKQPDPMAQAVLPKAQYNQGWLHQSQAAGGGGEDANHAPNAATENAILSYLDALKGATQNGDQALVDKIRKNLEVLSRKKEQSSQGGSKQPDQKQDQKQDPSQDNQNQSKDDQKKGDGKNQSDPKDDKNGQNDQSRAPPKNMTQQDAQRILEQLSNRERDLQARLRRQKSKPEEKNENDW